MNFFRKKKDSRQLGQSASEDNLMPYEKKANSMRDHHDTDALIRLSQRNIVSTDISQVAVGGADEPNRERRNSQEHFASKEQTVIVFDWDDTLFPTTWVRREKGMHWRYHIDQQTRFTIKQREEYKKQLDRLSMDVERVINVACDMGHVVIVTLARSPWVLLSAENFFQRIGKLIKAKKIQIVYAQESGGNGGSKEYEKTEFSSDEEVSAYWTGKKQAAIREQVQKFYAKTNSSWKNVISIGDSDFERKAAIQSMEEYALDSTDSTGGLHTSKSKGLVDQMCKSGYIGQHYRRIRMKTVKMFDSPSIDDLGTEMCMLYKWLPYLVKKDGGFDVDLEDDECLYDAHRLLTGEDLK
eukprot:GEMP01041184.1.p1 GENE.GEMP01041184.1~~GEMP01041184.1.p1  ORF type:complete len:354 (+),score=72.82 GEMP01041184.1:116-1177(+)